MHRYVPIFNFSLFYLFILLSMQTKKSARGSGGAGHSGAGRTRGVEKCGAVCGAGVRPCGRMPRTDHADVVRIVITLVSTHSAWEVLLASALCYHHVYYHRHNHWRAR